MKMENKNTMETLKMICLMEKGSTQPSERFTVEFLREDS